MRSERHPGGFAAAFGLALAICLALAVGCRDKGPPAAATAERFAGVARQAGSAASAQSAFCEKSYPSGGQGARRWTPPPERPVPGGREAAPAPARDAWTWVNLWATWCTPCTDEMELMAQWRDGFTRDGVPVRFELWSVDEEEREKDLADRRAKGLPGRVRWLRSGEDLDPLLDALGVERGAMIPIHALVDPSGWVRCVRVGAIHEQDYAAVKAFLSR